MGSLDLQTISLLVGAALVGGIIAWLFRALSGKRRIGQLGEDWQARYDKAIRQIEHLQTQNRALETTVETERSTGLNFKHAAAQSQTELESLREKANALSKNIFTLDAERDDLAGKLGGSQQLLHATKTQIQELATEFRKSKEFYTSQLMSAVEQRQLLEGKVGDARLYLWH